MDTQQDYMNPEHLHCTYERWVGKPYHQVFVFIRGEGRVMLHGQRKVQNADNNKFDFLIGYEVTLAKLQKNEKMLNGVLIPAGYKRPSDNDWGTYGWTFKDIVSAKRKFNHLVEQERQRMEEKKIATQ